MLKDVGEENIDKPILLTNITTETLDNLIPLLKQNYFLLNSPIKEFTKLQNLNLEQLSALDNAINYLDIKSLDPSDLPRVVSQKIITQLSNEINNGGKVPIANLLNILKTIERPEIIQSFPQPQQFIKENNLDVLLLQHYNINKCFAFSRANKTTKQIDNLTVGTTYSSDKKIAVLDEIICIKKEGQECTKLNITFKHLTSFFTRDYDINQASISPSGQFLFVEQKYYNSRPLYLFNINTSDNTVVTPLTLPVKYDVYDTIQPYWANDGGLLKLSCIAYRQEFILKSAILGFFGDQGSGYDEKQVDIIINPYSNNLFLNTGTLESLHIKSVLDFLNPNYKNKADQLIGIILLNYIIKELNYDSSKIDISLSDFYTTYIPEKVKSVLEEIKQQKESKSWFRSKAENVYETISNYKNTLFLGTAATALGLAAAYKYWTSKGNQ